LRSKGLNILIVNTLYYPQGGAPIYGLKLAEILGDAGQNAFPFSMRTPNNIKTPFSKYFVDYIDFRKEFSQKRITGIYKVLTRTFHYGEAKKKIEWLLSENRVDIVHLNNFLHYLTLSIIKPIKRRGIPIVWSIHDHVLVCPNTNLYNDRTGKPCAKCSGFLKRITYPAITRCKKDSIGASAIAAAEAFFIDFMEPWKAVSKFIAPSEFILEQHRRMGFDVSKFQIVHNFVEADNFEPHYEPGDYLFYFGRLSPEKGVEYLIQAAAIAKKPLVIAGVGPSERYLKYLAEHWDVDVTFAGFLSGKKLNEAIYGARIVVLPSVCYENAPLMVLEAFAAGKPVIGSNLGGITELLTEDVGMLFEPGNAYPIAEAIDEIWNDEPGLRKMGMNARKIALTKFSPKNHLDKVLKIYNEAIAHNGMA